MNPIVEIRTKYACHHQMDMAVDVLNHNIVDIQNVSSWAHAIGYSRAHFCRKFTAIYGENPKMVLRRARFKKICKVIQSDWSATAYKVALEAGIRGEKALHKFLNRNFNMGFVALKNSLKREAFRSRNYLSIAADDECLYNITSGNPLNSTAFPESTGLK